MNRRHLRRRALLGSLLAAPALAQTGNAEWRLGGLFPLSGASALLGDEAARGLELAIAERNAAGGRPLRLIRADVTEAGQALTEARRLIQQERVALLFGSVSAPIGLAASQAAESLESSYVELAAAADTLTERGARHFIRTAPSAADYGQLGAAALTRFLPNHMGQPADGLRIAILHEASASLEAIAMSLEARLREAGLVVAERLPHAARTPEMPATVQRLRAAGVNVLIHAAAEGDAVGLFRAMQDAAWRPAAVIGAGLAWGLADLARAIGPALDACFALDVPPIETAERWAVGARPFAEAYQRRWGSAPRSGLSLAAYAGAQVILAQPNFERVALRAGLAALDQAEGLLPNGWGFRLDDRGQNSRARPVLMQWQAGRPVAVFPAEAAAMAPV
ncbi:ABC transporter substrate-binding protein [Sediminicoccus sp. KRV36]|uniref:ABC transporter substrate-binding protein n=1 Tax=Sediminicoccus sp. KRV36 TaxID=3133721 RepID=UPI00200BF01F|nr:ABC transporter substrate-binding protein [Sediminicoccus rosea]UPY39279.1 ABC transporter substrate-binding protein [Sediminicoccus rosea]